MITKHVVSCDPKIYEAWPDIALTPSGKLVCVFSECTHHCNRDYTRIVTVESTDRGRTWSAKKPVTEGTRDLDYYYNCAQIRGYSFRPEEFIFENTDKIRQKG